jgi:hypothetical protein
MAGADVTGSGFALRKTVRISRDVMDSANEFQRPIFCTPILRASRFIRDKLSASRRWPAACESRAFHEPKSALPGLQGSLLAAGCGGFE